MNKTVSVIVPVYNVQKYLRRCLDSIRNQTYQNLEIILIDDGSTDGSASICDEYADLDSRVKVVHKSNGGVSSARNLGLNMASGDYIGFIDSDDYIAPEMYAVLVSQIDAQNADISICSFYDEVDKGSFQPYRKESVQCKLSQQEQIENLLSNKLYCCSCCDKMLKKHLVADVRFDENITQYEDMWFLYQVMKRSERAAYTSQPLYYYCTNTGSASKVPFNDSMMDIVDVSENIFKDIKNNMPDLYKCAKIEFMRNNIMCASNAVRSGYKNMKSIKRIQRNIRKYVLEYLFSGASTGYKIYATAIALNWNLFRMIV